MKPGQRVWRRENYGFPKIEVGLMLETWGCENHGFCRDKAVMGMSFPNRGVKERW